MKKKLLTLLSLIIIFIVALPFVGNRVINSTMQQRLSTLQNYGIAYKIDKEENGYLLTHKRFIFSIENVEKFHAFIESQAKQQLPPYLSMMTDGTQIAVDIKYANIPLFNNVSLDITPNSLPLKMSKELKFAEPEIYQKLEEFIVAKKLLYHIDYDIVKMYFNGYIKDMDEKIILNSDYFLDVKFKGIKFNGHGLLIHPRDYNSEIETMYIKMSKFSNDLVVFDLKNAKSSGEFISKIEYSTYLDIENFNFTIKQDRVNNILLEADNFFMDLKSEVIANKIKAIVNNSIQNFEIDAFDTILKLEKFKSDIKLSNIDKNMFLQMQTNLERAKRDSDQESKDRALQYSLGVLSKGLQVDIETMSVNNINYNGTDLDFVNSKLHLVVEEDKDFGSKLKTPNLLFRNINLKSNILLSEKFFQFFKSVNPVAVLADKFAKKESDGVSFDVEVSEGQIKVNDKEI